MPLNIDVIKRASDAAAKKIANDEAARQEIMANLDKIKRNATTVKPSITEGIQDIATFKEHKVVIDEEVIKSVKFLKLRNFLGKLFKTKHYMQQQQYCKDIIERAEMAAKAKIAGK